jgi:hypothetical protein
VGKKHGRNRGSGEDEKTVLVVEKQPVTIDTVHPKFSRAHRG